VVLPCAGAGTRFSAPYPKELHCVAPGITVLDLSLAPFLDLAAGGTQVRLITVVSAAKMATVRYLARFADLLTVVVTYQAAQHGQDLRGAVRAALPLCTADTFLVLPDQYCCWAAESNPARAALDCLPGSGWAVLAAPADDPATLTTEGALRIEQADGAERVVAAADKPADPSPYNAAWMCIAATAEEVTRLPDAVAARGGGAEHPLVGAAAIRVAGYRNVTTPWDA